MPDPWYAHYHYSHPSLAERLEQIDKFKRELKKQKRGDNTSDKHPECENEDTEESSSDEDSSSEGESSDRGEVEKVGEERLPTENLEPKNPRKRRAHFQDTPPDEKDM